MNYKHSEDKVDKVVDTKLELLSFITKLMHITLSPSLKGSKKIVRKGMIMH